MQVRTLTIIYPNLGTDNDVNTFPKVGGYNDSLIAGLNFLNHLKAYLLCWGNI